MEKEIEKWLETKGIEFLKKVGIKPGQTVLDFGCGKGNYSIPAARIRQNLKIGVISLILGAITVLLISLLF